MIQFLWPVQITPEYARTHHTSRVADQMREDAWKTHMEATVGRLDRSQTETIGVLKDMKEMLVAMATSTHGMNTEFPRYNPPNSPANVELGHGSVSASPINRSRPQNPPINAHHAPSSPNTHSVIPQLPPTAPTTTTPVSTSSSPQIRIAPVAAPAAIVGSPSPPPAPNNIELGDDDLSSDPDFMTQPRSRVTRSHSTPVPSPVKKKVQRKYLKSKAPLHDVPPIEPPVRGRISPRDKDAGPIACNKRCWILHPNYPDLPVAYGKSGISWKSKSKNLQYTPCDQGQQMVQVHFVYEAAAPLLYSEFDRQPFRTITEAKVPQFGSGVYVKWASHLLVRDNTTLDVSAPKP